MSTTEELSFGYLINDVTLLVRKHFDRRAIKYGLTRAQWRATKMLNRFEGLRQNELAEQLDMEPIAVGRVIDRLQAAGFVERRTDPRDRRAWRLYITEQARAVIDDMEDVAREVRRDATLGISVQDMLQMMDVMNRIKSNLQTFDQGGDAAADPLTG